MNKRKQETAVQGIPHTDHPPCVSPVLGAFGRPGSPRLIFTQR